MAGGTHGALQTSDLGIGRLFELVGDAIVVGDAATGRVVLWNKAATRMFGYTADEAVGMLIERLVPASLLAAHREGLSRYRETGAGKLVGQEGTVELPASPRDGRELWVDLRLSAIGVPAYPRLVLAIIRDVTERHRVRADLARRSQELAERIQLVDLSPDAVFASDAERLISFWSRGAELTYGWTREEAIGRKPVDLLQTGYPIPLEEIEEALAEDGFWEGDLIQLTKNGERITVGSRWAVRRDDEGRLIGILEVDRDITTRLAEQAERADLRDRLERERVEARVQQTRRLESLGQLAGGVAHDFNNMLTVILNYAALLGNELPAEGGSWTPSGRERMQHDVDQITSAGERAALLTRQLLVFAHQEVVQPQFVNLNAVVADVQRLLERTLGEHIEVVMELAPEVAPVLADPGKLEQALINLAVNARDAMPGGGTLTFATENIDVDEAYAAQRPGLSPGPHVRLRVSDTGSGMSAKVAASAFDPFFTTKPEGEGTGLGLSTVYGTITQAGGHVHIYSEPDKGTTFHVVLPAVDKPDAAAPAPAQSTSLDGDETVLVVEDEVALREVVRRILSAHGYHVLVASGGAEALATAAEHPGPIHLLLTDVVMPKMLGPELAQRISEARPATRILFMSGYAPTTAIAMTRSAAVVEKPFSETSLLTKVREVLN
jgi:PAS domain S-box-containing protein